MTTAAPPTSAPPAGGRVAARGDAAGDRLHAGAAHRRAAPDPRHGGRVRHARGDRPERPPGDEGLGPRAPPPAALRRARTARDGRAGGLRRSRARQGLVGPDRREPRPRRVVQHGLRGADRARHHADPRLRDGGPEAALPAGAGERRDGGRVLPERVGLGIRRPRREDARHAAGGRQLRAERREDVDHERRLRRRLHRVREGRRRAVHRLHRRAGLRGGHERRRGAQDGPARLVDHAGHPARRPGAGGERARRDRPRARRRLQRPELRPLQARGVDGGRRAERDRRGGAVRGGPAPVREADRRLRGDPPQARRDDAPDLCRRGDDVPHGGPPRRRDRRLGRGPDPRRRARGVRRRVVHPQGRGQRDAALRPRRERADPRRQRLRQGLPGGAPLPRQPGEPHLPRAPTRSTGC